MKTKFVVLLTALATCMLFTLFAYCTKDGTNLKAKADLAGTTWKVNLPMNAFGIAGTLYADFAEGNVGRYRLTLEGETLQRNFTYSLNESHGTVVYNPEEEDDNALVLVLIDNATLVVIDDNHIGIGGRVFTKQ